MAEDDTWLQESVIEFLRGPCYTNPLMGFIDEKCAVFDTDEENKLEYTQIHHEFQEVVDELISSFLEEIGVSAEQFASTVADNVSNEKLNSFVLNSILTVEDFVQFKAMMVKRNLDLTNQVLAMMEEQQLEEVIAKQKNWEEEIRKLDGMTDDDMLQEALRLSKEQFGPPGGGYDQEVAAAVKASAGDDDAEFSEEFRKAMAMSMKEQAAVDLERAELEQALALSLALEQEEQKQRASAPGEEASGDRSSAPAPASASPAAPAPPAPTAPSASPAPAAPKPVAAAAAPPAPAPLKPVAAPAAPAAPEPVRSAPKPAPAPAGAATSAADAPAPPPAQPGLGLPSPEELPAVGLGGAPAVQSLRGNVGAGYQGAAKGAADHGAVRAAAEAAARAQKEMLLNRKSVLQKKSDEMAQSTGQVSELERQRREAYLKQQREHLLAVQKQKRELELEEYLHDQKKQPKPAAAAPQTRDEIQDAKRAELRHSLAQQIKQQMIAKQQGAG
eukprot:jgi/Tetstr1/450040/TSEL_037087.t1